MAKAKLLIGALLLACGASGARAQSTPPDPKGDWHGTLHVGAVNLRLAFHLGDTSTFDSPDQGALGLPAQMSLRDGKVIVTLRGAGEFAGTLSADGQVLAGSYSQGGSAIPLTLERGLVAKRNRPQTPRPPFSYRSEDVGYDNPAAPGIHLAGTLTLPPGPGPFPAVLLITGSGAQDRDETLFEHKPFAVLADALTRRGIAVLRVDDRGVGGSSKGTPNDTTLDYAGDVAAGVAFLRAQKSIDPARVGLLGHSEGGLIAPLVAAQDGNIAFVVMWAGPGVAGRAIIADQAGAILAASGADAAQVMARTQWQQAIVDALLSTSDAAMARAAVNAVMTAHGAPPLDDAAFAVMHGAWYRTFLTTDPAPALRMLAMPVLALLGGKDVQVSAALNEKPLRAALAGNDLASVEILPGLNHLFQTARTGAPGDYGTIEETIAPVALERMVDWIALTAGARAGS